MKKCLCNLNLIPRWYLVLLGSLFLGVVGLQTVHIAHTHKMITGQPLLLDQDHHGLSHLPPLFLSRLRPSGEPYSSPSSTSEDAPSAVPPDDALLNVSCHDTDWDTLVIIPFISLTVDGNCYVVLLDAPNICPSNIEITLCGRELSVLSRTVTSNVQSSRVVHAETFWERRIRLPGPVSTTGPPIGEFSSSGQLRITLRKEDAPPKSEERTKL